MDIVQNILQVAGAFGLCAAIGAGLPLLLCWAYEKSNNKGK